MSVCSNMGIFRVGVKEPRDGRSDWVHVGK